MKILKKHHKCELRFIGRLDKTHPSWMFYNCNDDRCEKQHVIRTPKKS